jgi:uncharacterized circularly permuted ATP-grasp superfamily protein
MQSEAKDVDTYLKEVPEDRRQALTKIRELCLKELKGYNEAMMYEGVVMKKIKFLRQGLQVKKILLDYIF